MGLTVPNFWTVTQLLWANAREASSHTPWHSTSSELRSGGKNQSLNDLDRSDTGF